MKFVISIPIATTSTEHDWFLKSASASTPENRNYSDVSDRSGAGLFGGSVALFKLALQFYYWKSEGDPEFFASHKGLSYLHEKGNDKAAVLNWQNSNVRSHMFVSIT